MDRQKTDSALEAIYDSATHSVAMILVELLAEDRENDVRIDTIEIKVPFCHKLFKFVNRMIPEEDHLDTIRDIARLWSLLSRAGLDGTFNFAELICVL